MMGSKFDHRNASDYAAQVQKIPTLQHQPHIGRMDLQEVVTIMQAIPPLKFPINSAGALLDALGRGKTVKIVGLDVDPARMIKYVPAYYFPIVSSENFVEKMAELIRANRSKVDPKEQVEAIRKALPSLKFPITSPDQLGKSAEKIEKFRL